MAAHKQITNNYYEKTKKRAGRHKKSLNKDEKASFKKYRGQGR
jgi:hypothetical protein